MGLMHFRLLVEIIFEGKLFIGLKRFNHFEIFWNGYLLGL